MSAINERELVERCRSGDERAFQELVETYERLVFALIARTIQEPSRAEDLAQDVFLRIHRGLPYFRGEARLSTWIYRIVANVCLQDQTRPAPVSLDEALRHEGRHRRDRTAGSATSRFAIGWRKPSRVCPRTTGS
jgi:RNA polymerase sigma factor (sigma-70 family)